MVVRRLQSITFAGEGFLLYIIIFDLVGATALVSWFQRRTMLF